jgi:hypothetical protein
LLLGVAVKHPFWGGWPLAFSVLASFYRAFFYKALV